MAACAWMRQCALCKKGGRSKAEMGPRTWDVWLAVARVLLVPILSISKALQVSLGNLQSETGSSGSVGRLGGGRGLGSAMSVRPWQKLLCDCPAPRCRRSNHQRTATRFARQLSAPLPFHGLPNHNPFPPITGRICPHAHPPTPSTHLVHLVQVHARRRRARQHLVLVTEQLPIALAARVGVGVARRALAEGLEHLIHCERRQGRHSMKVREGPQCWKGREAAGR